MRFAATVVLALLACSYGAVADAQPRPGGGRGQSGGGGAPTGLIVKLQTEQIAKLFADSGFQSKAVDNDGTQMVVSTIWNDQIFSGAIPQSCEKDGSGCHAFKIFANLGPDTGVSQAWIDSWNNSWLYVRAYKVENGSLIFSWDVALLTGVTPEYIKAVPHLFKSIVDESTDFKPK